MELAGYNVERCLLIPPVHGKKERISFLETGITYGNLIEEVLMSSQGKNPKGRLFLALGFTLVFILVVEAGYVGYQVKTDLDGVIYNFTRYKIGERDPEDLGLPYRQVEFTFAGRYTRD